VGEQAAKTHVPGVLVDQAASTGQGDSNEAEIDKGQMPPSHVVEDDHPQTSQKTLAKNWITLVEVRVDGSGRLEGLLLTTEPGWQDKGTDEGNGNVRAHPETGTSTVLTDCVTGWQVEEQFGQTVQQEGHEAEANEPAELIFRGVGDQLLAHKEDNGESKDGNRHENVEQTEDGVDEAGQTLIKGHLFDGITPQAEAELESSVNSTNRLNLLAKDKKGVGGKTYPASSLLQVRAKTVGNSSKLQRFVNKGSLPSLSKHHSRSSNVFGQGAEREPTNVFEGFTAEHVAGAGTPGNTEGILDTFQDVDEEIQALAKRIILGYVVEELGRASEGHAFVEQHVRHQSTQPVLFGNHVGVESSSKVRSTAGQLGHFFKAIVEITGLEMMGLARDLFTSHVVEVEVGGLLQTLALFLQVLVTSVVEDDNAELVDRVVNIAGSLDSVQDQIRFFAAAGDKDIDFGHVVASKSELGSFSWVQHEHGHEQVHVGGQGNGHFNGNEDPGHWIRLMGQALRVDDGNDTVAEVGKVGGGRQQHPDWGGVEQITLPVGHVFDIVTLGELDDGAIADPVSLKDGTDGFLVVDQRLGALVGRR
jgi:hypothetical protein